mgnify:CR=1 FL=1
MTTLEQAKQARLNTTQFEERLNEDIDEVLASNAPRVMTSAGSIDEALSHTPDYYINPILSEQARSVLDLIYNQKRCPRCSALLAPTVSISGAPSTDWLECSNNVCNSFVDTYHPMEHQAAVHLDPHRIIGNFGSYGTGKTKHLKRKLRNTSSLHLMQTFSLAQTLHLNMNKRYYVTLRNPCQWRLWSHALCKKDTLTSSTGRVLCYVHSTTQTNYVLTTTH